MAHKHENTEQKQKQMKEMLAKKFKREKEMMANMKLNDEDKQTEILIKQDKVAAIRDRKRTQD